MSDLLVSVHTPTLGSGRSRRTYALARALAATGDGVGLLYARFGAERPDAAFTGIPGVALHEVRPSRGLRRLSAYVRARATGVPADFARGVSSELADAAEALARNHELVIADGPIEAATLTGLARERPVIYHAHNLESAFRHQLRSGRLGSRDELAAFERRLLAGAAESWMVSEADAQAARALCPEARVRVVPSVVDVAAIAPVRPAGVARVLFLGDFRYEPNREALEFLRGDVLPQVWASCPDARLRVVGRDPPAGGPADSRVEVLGFVPELDSAYAEVACVAVPLLHGGGSPLKFIEALAYGLPVVATSEASRGLEVRDGTDCLIADGAEAFAAALVRVLRLGGEAMGARGRELAAARYSQQALNALVASRSRNGLDGA